MQGEKDPTAQAEASEPQTHEEALPEGHNPDVGTPESEQPAPEPADETEKLRREVTEWKDKYLRLFAEFDNFRKRSMKERSDLSAMAGAELLRDMLPVLDDLERAIKANETATELEPVKEGFLLIYQKFLRKLEAQGIKPIEAQGQPFNTDYHEAVTSIQAPADDMKGKVVDVVERGYTLNDKVLRFAKVVIGQ